MTKITGGVVRKSSDEYDELRGYGEYRGVLTPDRPKHAQQGLTQLRPHLRNGENLLLMLQVLRMSAPKSSWLGVTSDRLLLVHYGTLTFEAGWDNVRLEPLSQGLRVHRDSDKPLKIPVNGGKGAHLEGLLAVCRSRQADHAHGRSGADAPGHDSTSEATGSDADAIQTSRTAAGDVGVDPAGSEVGGTEAASIPAVLDSLRELAELHINGVLTDEEFNSMKARILSGN